MHRPVIPFYFENPFHSLILFVILFIVLIVAFVCEWFIKRIERKGGVIVDNKAFVKAIRQQVCRISDGKSGNEINEILDNMQIAIRTYKRARRRAFWAATWAYINSADSPRLFF